MDKQESEKKEFDPMIINIENGMITPEQFAAALDRLMEVGDAELGAENIFFSVSADSESDLKLFEEAIDKSTQLSMQKSLEEITEQFQDLTTEESYLNAFSHCEALYVQFLSTAASLQEKSLACGAKPYLDRLKDFYLSLLEASKFGPERLAQYFFNRSIETKNDFLANAYNEFGKVLGKKGKKKFKQLVKEAYGKLGVVYPWEQAQDNSYHEMISKMYIAIATVEGDSDMMYELTTIGLYQPRVAMASIRSLSTKMFFMSSEVAEQGLQVAQNIAEGTIAWYDLPYEEHECAQWLIEHYQECGNYDDALKTLWYFFFKEPSIEGYERLKEMALEQEAKQRKIGIWQAWYEKLLDLFDEFPELPAYENALTANQNTLLKISIALAEEDYASIQDWLDTDLDDMGVYLLLLENDYPFTLAQGSIEHLTDLMAEEIDQAAMQPFKTTPDYADRLNDLIEKKKLPCSYREFMEHVRKKLPKEYRRFVGELQEHVSGAKKKGY